MTKIEKRNSKHIVKALTTTTHTKKPALPAKKEAGFVLKGDFCVFLET